jgi:CheY-like chemotaxis protein
MKKNTIILIDDDDIQHYIVKTTLNKIEPTINLIAFLSASKALEYLKNIDHEQLPIFILLDLNMHIMDGWEFLNTYKNFESKADVMIVTSSIDQNDIIQSKKYQEVKQFISKPLNKTKLQTLINSYNVNY